MSYIGLILNLWKIGLASHVFIVFIIFIEKEKIIDVIEEDKYSCISQNDNTGHR